MKLLRPRFAFGMAMAVLSFVAVPLVAMAQVTFTVTGTIDTTGEGFTAGQAVTFSFTLAQSPSPGTPGFVNNTSNFYWIDETIGTDTALFSNVTGSPLAGSYFRPNATASSPGSSVSVTSANVLAIKAGSSNWTDSMGLTQAGNEVTNITFNARFTGLTFDLSSGGPLPDANTFFGALAGTYTELDYAGNNTNYFYWDGIDTNLFEDGMYFTPTSLTISAGAVPEPSTYAAIFGACALGLAAYKRRKAAPKA